MNNAQTKRILSLSIVLIAFSHAAAREPQGAHPGLVKDKPASGHRVKTKHGYMVPYKKIIPGTEVSFEMIPIPGGTFTMGSPAGEQDRRADEGPQFRVRVEPFWMNKTEITWGEYKAFMSLYPTLKKIQGFRYLLSDATASDLEGKTAKQVEAIRQEAERRSAEQAALRAQLKSPNMAALEAHLDRQPDDIDAITAPTELYEPDITYEYGGEPDQPAVTMTQYAAKQYSKWLSKLTGTFYRLPSEAEWEYACRAGTTTAYHFGHDPAQLADYAWYGNQSNNQLPTVATKKPNPWGLHDMHGGVAEWVLDAYDPQGYSATDGKTISAAAAINWPKQQYPRTVRGGSWEDGAAACRSAARLGSNDEEWKDEDPNLPLSPWWYTSDPTRGIGFRLIEPLEVPDAKERAKFWEIDVDDIRFDVGDRLEEGRGVRDNAHVDLPTVIRQVEQVRPVAGG